MSEFLLEIYSEEIPAYFQKQGEQLLKQHMDTLFTNNTIPYTPCETWSTPRRIGICYQNLPSKTPAIKHYKKGPRIHAPTQAIDGFLHSSNATQEDLRVDSDNKGEFYYIEKHQPARPMAHLLAEFIPQFITAFNWKKTMRWSDVSLNWIRPVHTILCLFDTHIVPFRVDYITAGNTTYGHSVMHNKPLTISHFSDYKDTLQKACVHIHAKERSDIIATDMHCLAHTHNLKIIDDPSLLDEVSRLVEYPVVLLGRFKPDYLVLPENVIISILRYHQKFFCLREKDTNTLAPFFITVANIKTPHKGKEVLIGNERVVNARLEDGLFSMKTDSHTSLEDRLELLQRRSYFAGLGNLKEKAYRLASLSASFSSVCDIDEISAKRAGLLAKTDLTSKMVAEFPELQGDIGAYYATQQKENPLVISCIKSQYIPHGPHDSLPDNKASLCVALADKFDTLIGFFGINEKPTSSRDPFALRRAALGIIRICIEKKLNLAMIPSLEKAIYLYQEQGINLDNDKSITIQSLKLFFIDRLRVMWCQSGIKPDRVESILALMMDDALLVTSHYHERLQALDIFLQNAEGEEVCNLVKRAMNIVNIERKKEDGRDFLNVNGELCHTEHECTLYRVIETQKKKISSLLQKHAYTQALKELLHLKNPVNNFFDNTLVNCKDPEIRYNRLAILTQLILVAQNVARFDILQE